MEIRALRRQHYFIRLCEHFYDKPDEPFNENIYEENMNYEELIMNIKLSRNEKTIYYHEKEMKYENEKKAL